ncbi:MAG: DNA topoisomerase I [Candidatus Woesearchaeota archaeon]|nr:DNA topoisomerase I [Candidatus Woesearchaeota archaeon]
MPAKKSKPKEISDENSPSYSPGKGYELIITEKPKVAMKIAESLSEGKIIRNSEKGVPYYEISRSGKKIMVGCAVGHLFGLMEEGGNKWKYPVFDVEWVPNYKIDKKADYTKKYIDVLKKISKGADSFTVATDYDVEGEVIGLNVIRHICGKEDGARMKFSALTKQDLVKAYEKKSPTIDWGQAEAGLLRHELDYYYGINISRALTSAIKTAGTFQVMSSGRVQGPALKIIVDKEEKIKAFVSKKYWQILLKGETGNGPIEAWHKIDKFWEKKEADSVIERTTGKKCTVSNMQKQEIEKTAPNPFDLTTLQMEAYRCFRINPKRCLEIAQSLYTDGLISYPRTSSQQLPIEIGYVGILSNLSNQQEYENLIKGLIRLVNPQKANAGISEGLSTAKLIPNQGSKTDPAHPAIYPTGIEPKKIEGEEKKLYDLVVKRFISTFGVSAKRERVAIELKIENDIFSASGITTKFRGWLSLYEPYAVEKEVELPKVAIGEEVKVKSIDELEKDTQPPKRYTPASIVKELSNKNLGTKATRATIVDTLFKRGYVSGQFIQATEIGIKTEKTLEKYCPEIVDEELTRHFEDEADMVMDKKKKREEVLEEAKAVLTKVLSHFSTKEKEVGLELKGAYRETRNTQSLVGECPVCHKGSLRIIFSKKTRKRFIACNAYPECKTTFGIPQTGLLKPNPEKCEQCGSSTVLLIYKGKRPWKFCLNPNCPSKDEYKSRMAQQKNKEVPGLTPIIAKTSEQKPIEKKEEKKPKAAVREKKEKKAKKKAPSKKSAAKPEQKIKSIYEI